MGNVNIRKRGKVYQYQFEAGKINGKRKRINKSGFKTKKEAEEAGVKAYNEYLNVGLPFKENKITYSDYLDYWLENYCETNLKYNTVRTYTTICDKYLKPYLGIYRLSALTSVKLNSLHRIVKNESNLLSMDTINLVFTKRDGTYIGTDVTKYPFNVIHNELGIKKCRFYDLTKYYKMIYNRGSEGNKHI